MSFIALASAIRDKRKLFQKVSKIWPCLHKVNKELIFHRCILHGLIMLHALPLTMDQPWVDSLLYFKSVWTSCPSDRLLLLPPKAVGDSCYFKPHPYSQIIWNVKLVECPFKLKLNSSDKLMEGLHEISEKLTESWKEVKFIAGEKWLQCSVCIKCGLRM